MQKLNIEFRLENIEFSDMPTSSWVKEIMETFRAVDKRILKSEKHVIQKNKITLY